MTSADPEYERKGKGTGRLKFSNKNIISSAIGVLFVVSVAIVQYINPEPFSRAMSFLDNAIYDIQLRHFSKPLSEKTPIVIVDIDNRSINEIGRWPWSRDKLAKLLDELRQLGAKVVAFDITFPENQENIAEEVIREIQQTEKTPATAVKELEALKGIFDFDARFANSLRQQTSVLGFAFLTRGKSIGVLPAPLFTLPSSIADSLHVPNSSFYLGNLEIFQKAAVHGGFINSFPDSDGILRSSPLLLRNNNRYYPALSLEAVKLFLSTKEVSLIIEPYRGKSVLEGIRLDERQIPLDPWGRILIPYRGGPYTLPYVSSVDVLNGKASRADFEGKLVFIGSTATAVGDLYPAAVAPVYPGIEVHATIAAGILEGYLPYKPAWGKGVVFVLILLLGISCALLLPHVGAIVTEIICLVLTFGLLFLKGWLWVNLGIDLMIFLPVLGIQVLVAIDMLCGYFFEARYRQATRMLFNQYVPPDYIDKMFKSGSEFGIKGENKELTVLFSDIRGFTSISESMSAPEIKEILDRYLTPMTQTIFEFHGTIDKYIGDAIMAFWGSPLEDPQHAVHAVKTGLAMHEKLQEFNAKAKELKWPELHIGIGINTGFMHVGDMGSKFRRAYTVIGDAVNLASRLESLTKTYHVKIIVGENTFAQTKDLFIYRKIDKIRVKGKRVPVVVYEPICVQGEENELLRAELEQHHAALQRYFERDWKEAEKLFETLRATYPQNSNLYEEYLQRIRNSPLPKPDWDGSLTLESK